VRGVSYLQLLAQQSVETGCFVSPGSLLGADAVMIGRRIRAWSELITGVMAVRGRGFAQTVAQGARPSVSPAPAAMAPHTGDPVQEERGDKSRQVNERISEER
jgi:hypothetical protein